MNKRSCGEDEVAAPPSIDFKEEDVLDETVSAATTLLSEAATEAMAVVLESLKSVLRCLRC